MKPEALNQLKLAGLVGAGYTLFAVFLTGYRVFAPLAEGLPLTRTLVLETSIQEFSGSYGAALLFPLFVWFAKRYTIVPGAVWRRVPLYGLLVALSSVALTLFMWGSRHVAYELVGLGRYDYGIMILRFPMEFFLQAVHFVTVIGFIHFFLYYQKTRDREVHAAQLESRLTQARLENLQAQLHPHFLFNTLNTISSLMYDDTRAADRLMTRLSDLLRRTFAHSSALETTLEDEMEWIDAYLAIMQGRFSDRLAVRRSVPYDTQSLLVPTLILQPLVENAICHGVGRRAGAGTVEIRAQRMGNTLRLEVRDDGPGMPPGGPAAAMGGGVGLANTAARLQHLYGNGHRFTLANGGLGGLTVTIDLPAHADGSAPADAGAPA